MKLVFFFFFWFNYFICQLSLLVTTISFLTGLEALVHTDTVCSKVSLNKKLHFYKLLSFYKVILVGGFTQSTVQEPGFPANSALSQRFRNHG